MRLFFAVALPDHVRVALARLRPAGDSRDYRWVEPSGMHVTLAFLGEQPEDQLPTLERVASGAARSSQRGALALGTAGSFGSRRAPRVLWVGLAGDVDKLRALQSRLASGLAEGGFGVEDREFSPHITLARRRPNAAGEGPPGWPPAVEPTHFDMAELTLFESQLSPRGATYVALAHWACGG